MYYSSTRLVKMSFNPEPKTQKCKQNKIFFSPIKTDKIIILSNDVAVILPFIMNIVVFNAFSVC